MDARQRIYRRVRAFPGGERVRENRSGLTMLTGPADAGGEDVAAREVLVAGAVSPARGLQTGGRLDVEDE